MNKIAAIGDKIRLIKMGNDPAPIESGATGTVLQLMSWDSKDLGPDGALLYVKWDAPFETRTLNLCYPEDKFEVISNV